MKTSILPVLMLSLLIGSCTNFVEVDEDEVSLAFSVQPAGHSQLPIPGFVARGEAGRIEGEGAIGTPVPCYDLEGKATRRGSEIVLEVTATRRDVYCVQVVAAFAYGVTLGRLEPGTYHLRVVHTHQNGGSTRTEPISEQEVRVR